MNPAYIVSGVGVVMMVGLLVWGGWLIYDTKQMEKEYRAGLDKPSSAGLSKLNPALHSVTALTGYSRGYLNQNWASNSMSISLTNNPLTEDPSLPTKLEETWSPEKIEAWRVIPVQVERGDPDGLWLGFPHPDGPDAPVMKPIRHPVGQKLKAKCCDMPGYSMWLGPAPRLCDESPGEDCASGIGYGCGFYAFKTRGAAVDHLVAARPQGLSTRFVPPLSPGPFNDHVVARVLLSGKVIEHTGGYRAEYMETVEFEMPASLARPKEREHAYEYGTTTVQGSTMPMPRITVVNLRPLGVLW